MDLSSNELSTVMLTTWIGLDKNSKYKPMSNSEWWDFISRLKSKEKEPQAVFSTDAHEQLKEMDYGEEEIDRILGLVSRSVAMAFSLTELEHKGIKVVTGLNKAYPKLLRRRLKERMPMVLFYAGNLTLSDKIGIGVAGSRNISEEDLIFTKSLAELAAKEKLAVYSGGAKGTDSASETAALQMGGIAVEFLSDSLEKKIRQREVRSFIDSGNLLLLSDARPDAGFTVARAMNRNKYIYASSYGTFIVRSDYNKGGTWAGATEALRHKYSPVFVRKIESYQGNMELINRGGIPFEFGETSLKDLIMNTEQTEPEETSKTEYTQMSLFDIKKIV